MEKIGALNRYICKACRKQVYTVNLNSGTTPFGVTCPHCGSDQCFSNFYRIGPVQPQTEITITHCFYRPTPARLDELNAEYQALLLARGHSGARVDGWDDHVLLGGLVFDRLGAHAPLAEPDPPWVGDNAAAFEQCRQFMLKTYGRAKQAGDPHSETVHNPKPAEDGKYGLITSSKKQFHTGEPLFLLRGADKKAVPFLHEYLLDCQDGGCSREHVAGIETAIDRFTEWQRNNPTLVKLPD